MGLPDMETNNDSKLRKTISTVWLNPLQKHFLSLTHVESVLESSLQKITMAQKGPHINLHCDMCENLTLFHFLHQCLQNPSFPPPLLLHFQRVRWVELFLCSHGMRCSWWSLHHSDLKKWDLQAVNKCGGH